MDRLLLNGLQLAIGKCVNIFVCSAQNEASPVYSYVVKESDVIHYRHQSDRLIPEALKSPPQNAPPSPSPSPSPSLSRPGGPRIYNKNYLLFRKTPAMATTMSNAIPVGTYDPASKMAEIASPPDPSLLSQLAARYRGVRPSCSAQFHN